MVGMQNHGSMFYLFKFADSQSDSHQNNSRVCFGIFHHLFILHSTYKMLQGFEVV